MHRIYSEFPNSGRKTWITHFQSESPAIFPLGPLSLH